MSQQPDLSGLINQASKNLGMNPNDLKQQIENGKLDALMKNLSPAQAQGVKQAMANPELAKKMMQSPQVQQMMKNFFKQK